MSRPSIRLHAPLRGARIATSTLNSLATTGHAQAATEAVGRQDQDAADARAQTEAALKPLIAALSKGAEELEAALESSREELPAFAVQLAVGIARELLRVEIDAGKYDMEGIVRGALAVANTGRSACTVHLHPDDLAACDPDRFRSNTKFEADPDIARGDLHVTTPQGLLVRDIDATLTRIREELMEASR